MHWGQIKTIFIISFLLLDIYLFVQFLDKQEQYDIGVLEHHASTIEEQLKSEDIKIGKLPEEDYEETFISVEQHAFKQADIASLKNQKAVILNNNLLVSTLEKKQKVPKKKSVENMDQLLDNIVPYAEEYSYWTYDDTYNVLIYFQKKLDRTIYYNHNAVVLLFLDDKGEVSFYTQTRLGTPEALAEKRKIIKPIRAIETLYPNVIQSGDEITKVNIGFHTRVPFETGVQVFAPVWTVTVNHERDYFVNAIEGFTFSTEERQFIEEVMDMNIGKLQTISSKNKQIKAMMESLKERKTRLVE